ncbi:MAG TPA: hypothetical protein DCO68_10170 [Methylophilaceae bacterium]|nr:hypothetical protein [Methylophilaceae bacterium]
MANINSQIIISAKDETYQAFNSIKGSINALNGLLTGVGIGTGLSAAGLGVLVKNAAEFNDEMGKAAQKTGVTVESLSALRYAADLSDVSFEGLQTGLKQISKTSFEAANGNKEYADSFKRLGVNVLDTNGHLKSGDQILIEIADKFAGLKDGSEKSALAMKLFGKSGAELIPLLNGGSQSIKDLTDEAKRFGLVVTDEAVKASEEFNDNLTRLESSLQGLELQLGGPAIESLANFTTALLDAKQVGEGFFGTLTALFTDEKDIDTSISELTSKLADLKKTRDALSEDTVANKINDLLFNDVRDLNRQIAVAEQELNSLQARKALVDKRNNAPKPKVSDSPFVADDKNTGKSQAQKDAEAAARAAQNFIDKLEKEAATLGKTKEDVLAYDAAQLKLTDNQKKIVAGAIEKIDAYNQQAKAAKELAEFEKLLQESDQRELDALEERTKVEEEAAAAREAMATDISQRLYEENQQLNIDLITDDKKRAKAQIDLEHERAIERIQSMMLEQDQVDALLQQETDNYQLRLKEVEASTKDQINLNKELGRQFTSAFEDAAIKGADFGDTLTALGQDLERLALQAATNPLFKGFQDFATSLFSDLVPNAQGGVYSGSGISAYSGQIVSTPTVFPFAKGVGLMGEGGPEAIMPLTRIGGKLGVRAENGATNVVVNIIGASSQPKINQSNSQGTTTIDVIFEQVEGYLGNRLAKGQGVIADVLSHGYGIGRTGAQG